MPYDPYDERDQREEEESRRIETDKTRMDEEDTRLRDRIDAMTNEELIETLLSQESTTYYTGSYGGSDYTTLSVSDYALRELIRRYNENPDVLDMLLVAFKNRLELREKITQIFRHFPTNARLLAACIDMFENRIEGAGNAVAEMIDADKGNQIDTALLATAAPAVASVIRISETDSKWDRTKRVILRIGSAAIAPISDLLESGHCNEATRARAVEIAGDIKNETIVPLLLRMLKPENEAAPRVRAAVARALGAFDAEEAADALLERIKPENEQSIEVRIQALESLGKMKKIRMTGPLMERYGEQEDKIKNTSAIALAQMDYSDESVGNEVKSRALAIFIERIESIFRQHRQPNDDYAVAIGTIGGVAFGSIISSFNNPSLEVDSRAYYAKILGEIGDEKAVESLIRHLYGPLNERGEIYVALGKIKYKDEKLKRRVKSIIMKGTKGKVYTRNAAIWALGYIGTAEDIPFLKRWERTYGTSRRPLYGKNAIQQIRERELQGIPTELKGTAMIALDNLESLRFPSLQFRAKARALREIEGVRARTMSLAA